MVPQIPIGLISAEIGAFCRIPHCKKSITNHGDLLTSKLCIAFHNASYVGYNTRSFKCDTAIQMILNVWSFKFRQLNILDHKLDHFSWPVLLHDSNVIFKHKISCCHMQCIIFMEANRRDSLWIFYSVR